MKSTITKISLILLAITMVYVVGFSMQHDGGHEECPVAAVAGGQCSFGNSGINLLNAANLHLNALKRVSLGALSYLWFAMFAAIFAIFAAAPSGVFKKPENSPETRRKRLKIKTFSLKKFLDWLIIREKRDPSIMLAVSA
jgi:hypothetical protein